MRLRPLRLSAVLLAATTLQPLEASVRSARAALREGRSAEAVKDYAKIRLTQDTELAAEYAYALATAGLGDLALGHLDQAYVLQGESAGRNALVHYFASQVFLRLGQQDIAAELALLSAPRPAWAPPPAAPAAPAAEKPKVDLDKARALANTLMLQKRFYTAADRFQKIVAAHPNDGLSFAGYAIALEKIGATQKAARAVARSIELQGARMKPEQTAAYLEHQKELESRPQQPPAAVKRAPNRALKGRYLAFLGGNLHRTNRNTVSNFNSRLGKFFTNRFDASITAGYTGGNIPDDYRGASFGIGGRYHQPLPVSAPLNVTLGSRVDHAPRPAKKTSVVVSPGLSWSQDNGSIDLFLDYGISGPLKKTSTISLGYTVYLGGRKK